MGEVKEDVAVRRGPSRGPRMAQEEIDALRAAIAREVLREMSDQWSLKSASEEEGDELLSLLLN